MLAFGMLLTAGLVRAIAAPTDSLGTQTEAPSSMQSSAMALPDEGALPAFDGATGWLNSPPLRAGDLRGKVVVVEFWTYSCVNWLRTLPYVRAWAEKYKRNGLVVIGVHSPEFPFEHDLENVRKAAKDFEIEYPIALDNNFAVWQSFGNEYWPALYFIDARGRIRHHQFGEGDYTGSEDVIRQLLAESGATVSGTGYVTAAQSGITAAADWADLKTQETYLGLERGDNFASPGGARPGTHRYAAPARLALNQWALGGDWTVRKQSAVLAQPPGTIAFRFHARDLNLVMGPSLEGTPIRFRVRIDGAAPGAAHGADADANGEGVVRTSRVYQLIRQPKPIVDRRFEIEFLDPGLAAYSFTFG
jgi:thiol-disulfide isomerase/thioredoxin